MVRGSSALINIRKTKNTKYIIVTQFCRINLKNTKICHCNILRQVVINTIVLMPLGGKYYCVDAKW